jgi:hypothetical protein
MEEGNQGNGKFIKRERDEVFSKVVRAGKRTYFFDVKMSRSSDLYITITESMKRSTRDGRFFYEKHKIFLYREDFENFVDGLSAMLEYVEAQPENKKIIKTTRMDYQQAEETERVEENEPAASYNEIEDEMAESYSSIDFEDLEEKR